MASQPLHDIRTVIKCHPVEPFVHIDPWGSTAYQDYARLRDAFGIAEFGPNEVGSFRDPHMLFRRGIVFGHRDFERVADAIRRQDAWTVMTGFMPSGDLHLGHKMVLEQVIAHTKQGADPVLVLADYEAMAARGFGLEKAHRIARDQYVHNALALGLASGGAPSFYFQTRRTRVKDLAHQFARKVNWSTLQALYGFTGETSLAHVLAPLVQAADILHPQLDEGGPRPILVPVGVDQDPHIRLTRDVAQDWRLFNVQVVPEGGLGVFARQDEDVKPLLDAAERALRDLGFGDLKRNDAYKAIYIRGGTAGDIRAVDLALARAEAKRGPGPALLRPSATFHRFMTGLQGGKMSSSRPETSVYLTDDPQVATKKVMASVTGGRATAEEQRRIGAEPHKCPVYELYLYHLAKDDTHLQRVHDECAGGQRLCGGCKKEAVGLLVEWLKEHKEKRDQVAHLVEGAIAAD